jgi:transcription elongation factor Elf1
LKCPYCGHSERVEQTGASPERASELDFASAEHTGNFDWGTAKKTVVCKSCGAETVYDALQVASECPYCGSNQVMEAGGRDTLAPGGVCPFRINVKTAGENFKTWLKWKIFAPGAAKRKAKPEAFNGVYLPYWTFDADTRSAYTGAYGYRRRRRRGFGKDATEEIYIEWHDTSGVHDEFIDDALVNATTRHDAAILSKIEPFDTAANVAYKPEYVAGYAAERYSVGLKDAWERAKTFIRSELTGSVTREIEYENRADAARVTSLNTSYANVKFKYLLLPVWMSAFKYGGKTYRFMVNGQTGEVGGDAPISPIRVAIAVALGIAAVAALWYFSQGQSVDFPINY